MPRTLAAMLPYIPPGLARALLAAPTLAPPVEQFLARRTVCRYLWLHAAY